MYIRMISTISDGYAASVTSSTTSVGPAQAQDSGHSRAKSQTDNFDSVSLSSTGQSVLENSAKDPFAGMTESALGDLYNSVMRELSEASDTAGLAKNAAQLPNPATTDRVTSAQNATEFVLNGGKNPFANLSRSELTSVIYDQSGKYTVNERIAALSQQQINDSDFILAASSKSQETGDDSYLYAALIVLDNHKTRVEKAIVNDATPYAATSTQLYNYFNSASGGDADPERYVYSYPNGW